MQSFVKKNVGIIAHGDADGLCSAALIKTIYPGALVLFSKASQLHKVMREMERRVITMDILFIVDIAISQKSHQFVLERLSKAKEKYKIYYYDNHILPSQIEDKTLSNYVTKYQSMKNSSSSAVVFRDLYDEKIEYLRIYYYQACLAAYGAIADYAMDCPFLKDMLSLYDASNTYYQAFLLKQASRVIDDDNLKRTIVDKLSVGILPSEIFEVVEAARMASREVSVAVNFIQTHAKRVGKLGIIVECPVASMGHNAYVAATMTQSPVGVAIRRQGGKAFFVLRRLSKESIHLGLLATRVGDELSCDGGGEEATAGITSEDIQINDVLDHLNKYITMLS
ncbi:MAG: hypothetical protein INQ03_19500 [Candidatus Heimdallarchaeota archaeon]|nr:hypothetical protein [Candidatus Heimdallarchaeota archaeon]